MIQLKYCGDDGESKTFAVGIDLLIEAVGALGFLAYTSKAIPKRAGKDAPCRIIAQIDGFDASDWHGLETVMIAVSVWHKFHAYYVLIFSAVATVHDVF